VCVCDNARLLFSNCCCEAVARKCSVAGFIAETKQRFVVLCCVVTGRQIFEGSQSQSRWTYISTSDAGYTLVIFLHWVAMNVNQELFLHEKWNVHPKTTHMLFEQPSVVCPWTGIAHLADQDEPGFERLNSTSSSTISASTRRGSVRRTVSSGENSWRQLCPAKDAPPDDDDDEMIWFGAEIQRWS